MNISADALLRFRDERTHVAAGDVGRNGLPPPCCLVKDHVAPGGRINLCNLPERYSSPFGVLEHEAAGRFRAAARGVIENNCHIKDTIPLKRLGDVGSLICGLHGIHDGYRLKSKMENALWSELYDPFRQPRLRFDLHVGCTGNRRHNACDVLSDAVDLIAILAEAFDRHLSLDARQDFFDALGQEWLDREIHSRPFHERIPNLGVNGLGFFSAEWNKIDVDFTVVRSPRVIRLLCPARSLGHRSESKPVFSTD